ncbi:NADH:ubiquinone oxidoreductase [Mameliella alba]|nr:NADH:ubiquinone oxidoreductase [Mameliella alba]MBY6169549.1 NADH:ubiquinone oxidoreductase [Mameliella alba]MBY6174568.1 NADH:ubiquinone oxidoreductase [Mameliella alba]
MTTPLFPMTPDFTPLMRMMQLQTRFAMEASQGMMKLAMMPWAGLPTGFGSICTPMGAVSIAVEKTVAEPVAEEAPATEPAVEAVEAVEVKAEAVVEAPAPEAAPVKPAETPAEVAPAPEAETVVAPVAEPEAAPAFVKPKALSAPKGEADDLTVLNGVGPKLAEALNAEGIYHYDQIAAWTKENVAWADENLAGVRGRASRNGWVAQAAGLVKK